jgi:aspartyl-tRNA(Asn)/glutamyl-tRNA(Gln) amidotransferase subunit C
MSIDGTTTRRVAKLAGLRLDEEAVDAMAQELSTILDWIAQLDDVDVEGVEPMIMAVHHTLPMREDIVTEGGDAERILSNAPKRANGFFVVPKVVD